MLLCLATLATVSRLDFCLHEMPSSSFSFINSPIYISLQVVELDFLYPSEGVHRRWDGGFRITSTAATTDQAALILSIPRRRLVDETQETLRTSQFPSTHVKVSRVKIYLNL